MQPSLLQLALLESARGNQGFAASVAPRARMLGLVVRVKLAQRTPHRWVCVTPVVTILSKPCTHSHWKGTQGEPSSATRSHRSTDETFPGAVKPSSPSQRETEDLPLEGCEALPAGIPDSAQPLQPRLCGGPPPWARPASQPAKANFKDTAPSSSENSRSLGLLELARVGERLLRAAKRVPLVAEELRVNALGGHVLVADGLLDACASEENEPGREQAKGSSAADACVCSSEREWQQGAGRGGA